MPPPKRPITLALIDDYDIVVVGVGHMFDKYQDRVTIKELDASTDLKDHVDIALYDSFAQPEADHLEIAELAANPRAAKVVVYTWNFHPNLVRAAYDGGAAGYLSKALPARELVEALERVQAGELVTSVAPGRNQVSVGLDWPGRSEGLSEREAEILALITQGKSNADIAGLVYLSPNSIKSYIRSAYRKIGVTTRVEAVLWGVQHGFMPDHHRIDHWIPHPV
ncbi:MAG: response regulator transcription factor [Ilumatobacteraceae bacterium]